jgi:energy-coupling factor transporter ATP-binding protein EcfA2
VAIELSAVHYRYAGGAGEALHGVALLLEPGRVVGVVGANEAGKSTLCLVAAGLAPAVIGGRLEGTVRIDGDPSTSLRPHELAQRCGVLQANPVVQLSHTTATVFEEVAFGPCNLALPVGEVVGRVRWAMEAIGIGDLGPRDPLRLSGGQAQLVALASVLALRPRYLVLDEPTSELDPAGTRMVAESLARVAAETNVGILIAEHKTDVLASIADEVVVLDRGGVALSGAAAAVLADARLQDLGVDPPSAVRLRRAIDSAGLDWSAELAAAVR